jgi:hypothetical protein
MNTASVSKASKMYNNLFNHCQKQYKNIADIQKAYIRNNQVYAIEYFTTAGVLSIPSCTHDSDKVVTFK